MKHSEIPCPEVLKLKIQNSKQEVIGNFCQALKKKEKKATDILIYFHRRLRKKKYY